MPFPNRFRRAGPGFLTPPKSLSLAALALVAIAACTESPDKPTGPRVPVAPSPDVLFPFNSVGNCLGEDYAAAGGGGGITETKGCTANDIRVAAAQVLEYSLDGGQTFIPFTGQQVSCDPGANIQLKLRAFLKETASSTRADIGVWVANDGGTGRLKVPPPPGSPPSFGQCNQYNLAPAPAFTPPNFSVVDGVTNVDNDACGDMFPSAVTNDSAKLELGIITAKCQGATPTSPVVHIGSCLSWTVPGPNHACPTSVAGPDGFRFGTLPSSSSKCNCEGFDVPVLIGGNIELKKVWVGTPGQTTLRIGTTANGSDKASTLTGPNGTAPLTTGELTVPPATYFVSEDGGLANYSSSLACTDNGANVTPGANGSVAVQSNHTVVCTFTNTLNTGSIELKKVWVGTPSQTTLNIGTSAGGSEVKSQQTGAAGAAPLTTGAQTVTVGTYFVSETGGLAGYAQSLACTDNGASITPGANNSVSVPSGHAVICTFTNSRDQGSVELRKAWVGTPGQTTLNIGTSAGGSEVKSQQTGAAGAAPLTTGAQTVNTGTYFVSETGGLTDYSSSLACTDNGASITPGANNSVSVTTGHAVVCTFTNTRNQGTIELIKAWVGTPGQTTLRIGTAANGSQVASQLTGAAGAAPLTTGTQTVNTGTYFVSETGGLTDYSSALACTDNGANVVPGANGSVSVTTGHAVICTFTNTRNQGTIELKKVWVGTPPGQTTLRIGTAANGSQVASQLTGAAGAAPLTTGTQTVNTGTYFVSETGGLTDYTSSLACTDNGASVTPGANGSVSVTTAHAVICTFTNTRIPPQLSITKTPDPNGAGYNVSPGGTATFTIVVANAAAGGTALDVQLIDTLPAGVNIPGTNPVQKGWAETPDESVCNIALFGAAPQERRLLTCNIGTLAAGASFTVIVQATVPDDFLFITPTPSGTTIEIDTPSANVVNNGSTDWVDAGLNCAASTKCQLDATGTTDNSFGQGTKEDSPVPTIVSGSIPNNKSDLLRFYVNSARAATGPGGPVHDFLYLAWRRVQAPNGTTNMDFELNQATAQPGVGNGVTPLRTANDILIKYDLSQGGSNPTIGFHRWLTGGGSANALCEASNSFPCWSKVTTVTSGAVASINTSQITDPIPPTTAGTNVDALTFGEAGIDLQAAGIFTPGSCLSFGSAYLKSRSSDAFSAEVKDFVAPVGISVSDCQPKNLDNRAWARASNYAPTAAQLPPSGGALNAWFSDTGQIHVSDASGASSFFKSPTNLRLAQSLMGDQAVVTRDRGTIAGAGQDVGTPWPSKVASEPGAAGGARFRGGSVIHGPRLVA